MNDFEVHPIGTAQRLAELERDAARYRWLRDCAVRFCPDNDLGSPSPWCVYGLGASDAVPCEDAELDAAIDAAMEKQQ